ncbi:Lipopolysaccharide-induced tumor necrosis factor-alpha factor homolog [Geodia barretti]|uniref:Lipopolysaccharide-induced tumor necrosis factor-alpha factor homolog n=1 Tax=Geodia barretti TaxID=519541 RepID=A0AA35WAW8_GEOBA|nr:Lipopolysaccharide-induced tumor necrosis factor-alpha factor homolog [Geodia barretti]
MADPYAPPPYPPAQNPGYPPVQDQGYSGYPPAQQTATTVVVQQQPVIQQSVVFRDRPVLVTDSNGQQVTTQLQFKSGALTWLICCAICWLTGFWCLALIPFCIDDTKDVYHITPTDGRVVGVYKRL